MRLLKRPHFWVLALLLTHAGLLAYAATKHSPAFDEVGHLPAGLSHWQLGNFELYRVNPPLVRMVAVLPVLAAHPKTDWSNVSDDPLDRPQFQIGRQFIADNGARAFWFFTFARWACIPFSLLGGYICFRWARELYGELAGLLALTLWCFCPNILGNAQMITPDTGAAALGITCAYLYWRWLSEAGWGRAFAAGVALGLAELTKISWIILFALWPMLWILWRWPDRNAMPIWDWLRQARQQLLILGCGLFVLNLGYGFEGSFTQLRNYRFFSEILGGPNISRSMDARNRFANSWFGALPMPVPRNYLQGIDVQKRDFENTMRSYLRGEWRQGGWWYYYFYALTVKVPVGVWILGLLAAWLGLTRNGYAAACRDELVLLAPALVLLELVSSQDGFNHHSRYVLPAFPFAFVWMSKVAKAINRRDRVVAVVAGIAVTWSVASSLWYFPHSLSYFNELAGGPSNGHAHLVDSNIDWGQDLYYLKDWLNEHPEARPLGLAYFGAVDPRAVGIEFSLPAKGPADASQAGSLRAGYMGPRPGWYAISVTVLRGYIFHLPDGRGGSETLYQPAYTYFQRFQPIGRAGYSIYIYHLTAEQCDRVREELGLPTLVKN